VSNKIGRLKEILQLPILYAAILGIFLSWKTNCFPAGYFTIRQNFTGRGIADYADLRWLSTKVGLSKVILAGFLGVLFRMGGGLIVSLILVKILALTGRKPGSV